MQKSADAVRVNVQLIKAANDSHLWADTYDRKLTDIFSVESEVAKAIAEHLEAKLTGPEEQVIAAKPTDNPEASKTRICAAWLLRSKPQSPPPTPLAHKDISKKRCDWIRSSPLPGRCFQSLTRQATTQRLFHRRSPSAKRRARPPTRRSPFSPISAKRYWPRGYTHYLCLKDYDTATHYFEEARHSLPNSSQIPESLAYVARRRGQWDRSEACFNEAARLNPRDVFLLTSQAATYICSSPFPEALRKLDQVLDIIPDDVDTFVMKARCRPGRRRPAAGRGASRSAPSLGR